MNRLACLLVVLVAVWVPLSPAQTNAGPAGHWEGSITVPMGDLKVIVDLDRDAGGSWIGDIDIPDQAVKDMPLRDIAVAGESVNFALAAGPGNPTFKGKLSADGNTLSGDFLQGGGTTPFSLKRAGAAKVVKPTANPPLPDKFTGKWEGKLETPQGTIAIVFHLANQEGAAVGTIDSPDQGATGIPFSLIAAQGSAIKLGVQMISGEYNGTLSDDGRTLKGEWSQGGTALPLVLKK